MRFIVISLIFLSTLSAVTPGIAVADCVSPAASGGALRFNNDYRVLQYCNGADWISFPKGTNSPPSCSNLSAWTHNAAANGNGWRAVVYGNGMFVSGSWDGTNRMMSSPDGIAWTAHSVATSVGIGMAFGNGTFVAIEQGNGGRAVLTSSDGVNWTTYNNAMPTGGDWTSVAYGDSGFVAVDLNTTSRVAVSVDGITWTSHDIDATIPGGRWTDIVFGNGRYVAVRGMFWSEGQAAPGAMWSSDGVNWSANASSNTLTSTTVTYGAGQFVAGVIWPTPPNATVMRSPDGENWTVGGSTGHNMMGNIAFGGGQFVGLDGTGAPTIYSSADGVTWSSTAAPVGITSWYGANAITFGNGAFVAVSESEGTMRAECLAPGCTTPDRSVASIIFNADHRVLQWCDGDTWHPAGPINPGGPNTGCVNPNSHDGKIVFNQDNCVLQYCDGDKWWQIGFERPDPCACVDGGGEDVVSALVSHYEFEDGSGATVSDSSASGNDATIYYGGYVAWSGGYGGGGLEFDADEIGPLSWMEGFGGTVRVPHIPAFATNTLTYAAWVRPRRDDAWQGIITKRIADDDEFNLEIRYDDGKFGCGSWSGDGYGAQSTTLVSSVIDTWVHVSCTLDADMTTKLYINGVLEDTHGGGETWPTQFNGATNTAPIGIAQRYPIDPVDSDAEGSFFDGTIDDVRIYSRTLTDAEIMAVYTSASCPGGG